MKRIGTRNTDDLRRRDQARMVRNWTVRDLIAVLDAEGIRRGYVVYENGEIIVSHKALKPIRSFFELSHDFGAHEAVFIGRDPQFETIFTAFVHDTRRGLSQGGLRLQNYPNVAELLTDGLRLSQGMTRKNALAGLNWGGGKGIIQAIPGLPLPAKDQPYPEERRALFHAYGRFVASLGGVYYTAEDMATYTPDMDAILSQNRFTTCISKAIGGSGNPSAHTARGVFRAMLAARRATTGSEDLRGVRVSVQGAGNVGFPLVRMLHDAGCRLGVTDFSDAVRDKVRSTFPDVTVIDDLDAIYDIKADIFSPCARTPLTKETIGRLHDAEVRMVCGAANNQLTNPEEDAETLAAMNITYVPDFLCNRMGIVNCADEWRGYLEDDVRLAAEQVYPDTLRVMRQAGRLHISTARAADMLADVAAAEVHPLIGHRGRRIVDHLIQTRWASEPVERTDGTRRVFVPQADEPSVHRAAIAAGAFTGGPASVAAMPVSTAFAPNLAGFLSPLLADVEARFRSEKPRRIMGVDPAGSALQNAVEQALPYERDDTSREHLILHCHDRHSKNDVLIRAQLERLGVGYDPNGWLDPMAGDHPAVVQRLFDRLLAAGLVREDTRLGYRCPECNTNLVASDVERKERQQVEVFFVRCKVEDREIEARVARVEYIPHAVGIAVRQENLGGKQASIPGRAGAVPVIFDKAMNVDAELIVPSGIEQHSRFARTHKLARGSRIYDQREVLMPD
ncbi:MAG: Glu/Leu/Phe/Val dehydrogenase dimerization domain-containing protein, partial [Thermoanaerobaculia bacterium]